MTSRNYLEILGVTPGMSRMTSMVNPNTLGPSFWSADQVDQIHYLGTGYDGRESYDADPRKAGEDGKAPADANVARIARHADGSCSSLRLEATADGWVDPGGATPRDFKVVNW